jgi:hypothetical protein
MSPVIITLLVLLGVGLLLALWLMGIYNGLVVAWNRFENARRGSSPHMRPNAPMARPPQFAELPNSDLSGMSAAWSLWGKVEIEQAARHSNL